MKFSLKWLKEFIDIPVDIDVLAEKLTMAGLEVEHIATVQNHINDASVIAEIQSIEPIQGYKNTYLCHVNDGGDQLIPVVSTAINLSQNMRTVLAKIGAQLPPYTEKIQARRINDIDSQGILCGYYELGLTDHSDQKIIHLADIEKIGEPVTEQLFVHDHVIDLAMTPNRGDCLSIMGLAREFAALDYRQYTHEFEPEHRAEIETSRHIDIQTTEACPRYLGQVIDNVNNQINAPLWMVEHLQGSGIKSINAVVDILNFVMLELGQPMHAFDNQKILGDIHVRHARSDEKLSLLNHDECCLQTNTLIIADDQRPIAMAGIMGGRDSAVQTHSTQIFLESAFFTPETLAGIARQYHLTTDSAYRFERGVDPNLQRHALARASRLICKYCGGQVGPVTEIKDEAQLPQQKTIYLRVAQIKRCIGIDIAKDLINKILTNLGMSCAYQQGQFVVHAPSYRFDVKTEIDLIEEIARIYGYHQITTQLPSMPLQIPKLKPQFATRKRVFEILLNRDYQEVVTYSFINPDIHAQLKLEGEAMILDNPVATDMSVMRMSLIPGLIKTLQYNLQHQQHRIRLFEHGLVFKKNSEGILKQNLHLAGLITGKRYKTQWTNNRLNQLFDIKNDVETVLHSFLPVEKIQFCNSAHPMLDSNNAIDINLDNRNIGFLGQLGPEIKLNLKLNIKESIYLFEIELEYLLVELRQWKDSYKHVSKFPKVKRDLSIIVDEKLVAQEIMQTIQSEAGSQLIDLQIIDIYTGEHIQKYKKSISFELIFQDQYKTFKDEEIKMIMYNIVDSLGKKHKAILRM